eukprot:gene10551-11671_t
MPHIVCKRGAKYQWLILQQRLGIEAQAIKLLKKKINEVSPSKDIQAVSETLAKWVQENFVEEAQKALFRQGKYQLAIGYKHFSVEPTVWLLWGPQRRLQHFEAFLYHVPPSYEKYPKPLNAGLKKKPCQKRRADLPEPEMFQDLVAAEPVKNVVTPVKQRKINSQSLQREVVAKVQQPAIDVFDPFRVNNTMYTLVHRNNKSMFPLSVKRCEECKIAFITADVIAVKPTAVRELINNYGKRQKQTGNIYLHYLKKCLKVHNQKFEFNAVTVPSQTKKHLSDAQMAKLLSASCLFEDM